VGALIILSAFPQNLFIFIPFFIGLKLVLEYSIEDERLFKALWARFKKTRIWQYFQKRPRKKKPNPGYLLKKRTYTFRNRMNK
jgi:hypothetical protein